MDPWQILNGFAAAFAFGTSQYTFAVIHSNKWPATVLHLAHSTILLWYAIVNLLLGFGWLVLDVRTTIPLFRYAFAPLVLTWALRQYVVGRRVVRIDNLS